MNINSINSYQSLDVSQSISKTKVPTDSSFSPAISTDTVTISNEALSREEKIKEIMKDYDVKNMSYNGLVELGSSLYKEGVFTFHEAAMFVPLSATLPEQEPKGLEGTGLKFHPDEPINFIDYFENELKQLLENNPEQKEAVAFRQNRVDTVYELYALQSK